MNIFLKKSFWKLYFSVFAVCIVFTLAGLGLFWSFIDSYEKAQPENFAASYAAALSVEKLSDLLDESLPDVFSPYEDVNGIRSAYLTSLSAINGDFTARKNFLAYTADKPVFYLEKGNTTVAEITLGSHEDGAFGFRRWKVLSSVIRTDGWAPQEKTYTVFSPKGAIITVNGIAVPTEARTETDVDYGFADAYVSPGSVLWDVYTVTGIYGAPDVVCMLNSEWCSALTEGTSILFKYPESMTKTYEITAPAEAQVLVNGKVLDDIYITDTDLPYNYLAAESSLSTLPTAVTYTLDGLFAQPEIQVSLGETQLAIREKDGKYVADYPDSHLYTCTIRAPKGSKVTLHGADCEVYRVGTEPVFPELSDQISHMPIWEIYTVTGLYVSPAEAVSVEREGEFLATIVTTESFDVQCVVKFPEVENSILNERAHDFLMDYIAYTGNGFSNIDANLEKVLAYVIKDSNTYKRIKNSREAIRFVTPVQKTTYNKQEIVSSVKYSEGLWEYAIEFDIDQNTAGYLRKYVGTFSLLFAEINGEWMLADMSIVTK